MASPVSAKSHVYSTPNNGMTSHTAMVDANDGVYRGEGVLDGVYRGEGVLGITTELMEPDYEEIKDKQLVSIETSKGRSCHCKKNAISKNSEPSSIGNKPGRGNYIELVSSTKCAQPQPTVYNRLDAITVNPTSNNFCERSDEGIEYAPDSIVALDPQRRSRLPTPPSSSVSDDDQ